MVVLGISSTSAMNLSAWERKRVVYKILGWFRRRGHLRILHTSPVYSAVRGDEVSDGIFCEGNALEAGQYY